MVETTKCPGDKYEYDQYTKLDLFIEFNIAYALDIYSQHITSECPQAF